MQKMLLSFDSLFLYIYCVNLILQRNLLDTGDFTLNSCKEVERKFTHLKIVAVKQQKSYILMTLLLNDANILNL